MKTYKAFFITGLVFFIAGAAVFLITMGVNSWAVAQGYDIISYESSADVTAIAIEMNAGEVDIQPYDGETVYVEYQKYVGYTTTIYEKSQNGAVVLSIENDVAFWTSTSTAPQTAVYIPQSMALNLEIELNAGTLEIANVAAGLVEIEVNAGSVELDAVQCTRLNCEVSAGSLETTSLTCDSIYAEVSAGSATINVNGTKSQYTISASVSLGNCNVSNQSGTTQKFITVECSLGSVTITFSEE